MTESVVVHDSVTDDFRDASGAITSFPGAGGGDVAGDTHAASSKTPPVDADELPLVDSAASFGLKKLTWANLKATIKAYTDTLYPSGSGTSSGTNTGDQTSVSGNAGTATALQTGRTIDGQTFDGTANVTVIAPGTHAATGKSTPVDADELALVDSAASNVLKKLTFANLKATLKTYFDTLYASSSGAAPIGSSELIYRYTVTGTDKASIDTGVDTADAGSNDWTNGDLIEIFITARTDESVTDSGLNLNVNNDTGSNYDRQGMTGANTTASAGTQRGVAFWLASCPGASATANNFGMCDIALHNYAGTVAFKSGILREGHAETTAANCKVSTQGLTWRSTAAITRFAVAPNTALKKLKVGTTIAIYKRRAT